VIEGVSGFAVLLPVYVEASDEKIRLKLLENMPACTDLQTMNF